MNVCMQVYYVCMYVLLICICRPKYVNIIWLYRSVYVCMNVCMHVCIVCKYTCVHASMCIYMYVYMYACLHTCMYVCNFQVEFWAIQGGIVLVGRGIVRGNCPGELSGGGNVHSLSFILSFFLLSDAVIKMHTLLLYRYTLAFQMLSVQNLEMHTCDWKCQSQDWISE